MAMPPTMVVVALFKPAVMMATAAVVLPTAVSMPLAALDLDDSGVRGAESTRCCNGHSRRRQGWDQRKSTGGKPDQQKPFHCSVPPLNARYRDREKSYGGILEFPF